MLRFPIWLISASSLECDGKSQKIFGWMSDVFLVLICFWMGITLTDWPARGFDCMGSCLSVSRDQYRPRSQLSDTTGRYLIRWQEKMEKKQTRSAANIAITAAAAAAASVGWISAKISRHDRLTDCSILLKFYLKASWLVCNTFFHLLVFCQACLVCSWVLPFLF